MAIRPMTTATTSTYAAADWTSMITDLMPLIMMMMMMGMLMPMFKSMSKGFE